jgi:hypothetical protein
MNWRPFMSEALLQLESVRARKIRAVGRFVGEFAVHVAIERREGKPCLCIVIAGLDPAIHEAARRGQP